MKSYIPYILFLILFLTTRNLNAQNQEELQHMETSIQSLFRQIPELKDDQKRIKLNEEITSRFEQALKINNSFNFPFDSLRNMGKLTSPDNILKIYTWNTPFMDGTQFYTGFIQYYSKSDKQYKVFKLIDKTDKIDNPENQILSPQNWYGALYYEIIPKKIEGSTYYTLLGFDFNNLFTSKKIIDVLHFENDSVPSFGKPIFFYENKLLCRIIFEYSARAIMALNYNKNKKMIVFDHLSPSQPSYQGNFRFYGPDFSYDGLKFDNNRWTLVKNIDIRN